MKKRFKIKLLVIGVATTAFFASCNNSSTSASGSDFEGVISYEIKTGAELPPEIASMFQNMEVKTYVKGTLSRGEEEMGGTKTVVITDSKNPNDPTRLIAIYGHKFAIKLDDSTKKVVAAIVPKIEYIDSANTTKQIAGYICKKAKVTITSPTMGAITSYVYYTADLPYADPAGEFKGLKGMPMEYTMNLQAMSLTMSAKTVEKKTLSDSLFTVPADYKQTSMEEAKKEIMSSMGSSAGQPSN